MSEQQPDAVRQSVRRLFDRFATNGRLLSQDYKKFAAALCSAMEGGDSVDEVLRVVRRIDTNGDDAIVFDEFWTFFVNPDAFAQSPVKAIRPAQPSRIPTPRTQERRRASSSKGRESSRGASAGLESRVDRLLGADKKSGRAGSVARPPPPTLEISKSTRDNRASFNQHELLAGRTSPDSVSPYADPRSPPCNRPHPLLRPFDDRESERRSVREPASAEKVLQAEMSALEAQQAVEEAEEQVHKVLQKFGVSASPALSESCESTQEWVHELREVLSSPLSRSPVRTPAPESSSQAAKYSDISSTRSTPSGSPKTQQPVPGNDASASEPNVCGRSVLQQKLVRIFRELDQECTSRVSATWVQNACKELGVPQMPLKSGQSISESKFVELWEDALSGRNDKESLVYRVGLLAWKHTVSDESLSSARLAQLSKKRTAAEDRLRDRKSLELEAEQALNDSMAQLDCALETYQTRSKLQLEPQRPRTNSFGLNPLFHDPLTSDPLATDTSPLRLRSQTPDATESPWVCDF